MGAKKLDTHTRQRQIVQEALKIALEHGLAGLSVAELASRSGLVPAGIYRHFESKNEIVDAVLDYLRDRLFGLVDGICRENPDSVERLRRLLTSHLQLLLENPGIPQVVFSEGIFSAGCSGFIRTQAIITGYLERVTGIVREGQNDGRIRESLDPKTVSVMFFGLILSTIVVSRATSGEFDATAHVANAWPTFVEAVTERSQE
jgi:AcrR family transcriptional regulator